MEIPSPSAPPRPEPRISEWFTESFNLFGREWKTWTLQGVLYLVLSMLPALPGLVMYYTAFLRFLANLSANSGASNGPPPIPADLFAGIGVLMGGGCVSSVLGVYLLAGMTRTAIKQFRGEPICVGDLFTAGDVLLPDLGAYIFGTVVLGLAFGICFIPGLWLVGLWLFVHPLIVEKRLSISEAFRQSAAVTRPHIAMYILWAVLILVVAYAGSIVLVGAVATVPIGVLMWMVSYRDVFGLPGALPPALAQSAAVPGGYSPRGYLPPTRRCPHCERPVEATARACPACGTIM